MFSEKEIIQLFLSEMPACKDRMHLFFESDAEVVNFGGNKLLFTTDEFSAEDFFDDSDPFVLGWNLAACTISDVLATGGAPLHYGHSATISARWDKTYIRGLAKGIGAAVKASGAGFIGGDLGVSAHWKYTGICLGTAEKPLLRKGSLPGESIYISGPIGLGNLQAAMQLSSSRARLAKVLQGVSTRFPMRLHESVLVARYASACIDSSDGTLNALNTLADMNGLGFSIGSLPIIPEGITACKLLDLPETLLFMGECGEYELVFTIPRKRESLFLEAAAQAGKVFYKIGEMTEKQDKILEEADFYCTFNDFNISARSYPDIGDYLHDLAKYIAHARKEK